MQEKRLDTTLHAPIQEKIASTLLGSADVIEINEKIEDLLDDERYIAQLKRANKKIITVGILSGAVLAQIRQLIGELNNLRTEVIEKKNDINTKSLTIKQRVNALLQSGKVNVDQTEYTKSEASVLQYVSMLDAICAELEAEGNFFSLFLRDTCPSHVIVHQGVSEPFDEVVMVRTKSVKHYIKTIYRDLSISYSRYNYGFETQLNRISYVESCMKHEEK